MKRFEATIFILIVSLMSAVPGFVQGADVGVQRSEQQSLFSTKAGFDTYIVFMDKDPAVAYKGDTPGLPATKPGKGKKINPKSAHVKKYTKYLKTTHDSALKSVGVGPEKKVYDYVYALNGFAVRLTADEAAALAKQPGVVAVRTDEMRFLTTDSSPDFLGLTCPAGPYAKGYDGEGVVVGVIDTGIWPEHPSLVDDGNYGPPPVTLTDILGHPACDFGNAAWNPDDAPFTCNNKLIGAREYLDT